MSGLYHILVIGVAVWAIVSGYRRGLFRQLGAVVAVVTGIVCARILAPLCLDWIGERLPDFISGFKRDYVVMSLAYGGIFLVATYAVLLVASPIGKLLKVLDGSVLNNIAGALFRLFQYMMILSVFYNIIGDMQPSGPLIQTSRRHDGNVVEGVVKIAPAILGFPDGEEVGYRQQLEDAKKIS